MTAIASFNESMKRLKESCDSISVGKCCSITSLCNKGCEKSQKHVMEGKGKVSMIFRGSYENFVRNGGLVLKESVSLFHGRTNPIRHFSIDELNTMNVEPCIFVNGVFNFYKGSWDGRVVLLKLLNEFGTIEWEWLVREIAVATRMATHCNAQKLLGFCYETKSPVLVYKWIEVETLYDRLMLKDKNQKKQPLEWKDRLQIAYEVSYAIAYLHTAFPRTIVYKNLTSGNVLLDQDNTVKLCDFSCCVSIPEGEEYVEENIIRGAYGYLPAEYLRSFRVAESTDVYSFGVLFLVVLTGRTAMFPPGENGCNNKTLVDWVWKVLNCDCDGTRKIILDAWMGKSMKAECIDEILDPAIARNGVTDNEHVQKQLTASIKLALWRTALEEESRPTMVDVATELGNIIRSS